MYDIYFFIDRCETNNDCKDGYTCYKEGYCSKCYIYILNIIDMILWKFTTFCISIRWVKSCVFNFAGQSTYYFTCPDNHIIDSKSVCNQFSDCADASDERNCGN